MTSQTIEDRLAALEATVKRMGHALLDNMMATDRVVEHVAASGSRRRCMLSDRRYDSKLDTYIDSETECTFHMFGRTVNESDRPITTAIIEDGQGRVIEALPRNIRFIDKARPEEDRPGSAQQQTTTQEGAENAPTA